MSLSVLKYSNFPLISQIAADKIDMICVIRGKLNSYFKKT